MRPGQDELAGRPLASRHAAIGWWSVFVFGALGLTLEALHALKVPAYLDVSNETRRLMWTLAHAHGTLLGVLHIAFAASLPMAASLTGRQRTTVSRSLVGASVLLPGGFFLGGIRFYAGDPGIGIVLVPPGAVLLLLAALRVALGCSRRPA